MEIVEIRGELPPEVTEDMIIFRTGGGFTFRKCPLDPRTCGSLDRNIGNCTRVTAIVEGAPPVYGLEELPENRRAIYCPNT